MAHTELSITLLQGPPTQIMASHAIANMSEMFHCSFGSQVNQCNSQFTASVLIWAHFRVVESVYKLTPQHEVPTLNCKPKTQRLDLTLSSANGHTNVNFSYLKIFLSCSKKIVEVLSLHECYGVYNNAQEKG